MTLFFNFFAYNMFQVVYVTHKVKFPPKGWIEKLITMYYSGALIQIGDFAGAYFTTTMALHTLNSLVLKRRYPVWFMPTVIFVGWFAAILIGMAICYIHWNVLF